MSVKETPNNATGVGDNKDVEATADRRTPAATLRQIRALERKRLSVTVRTNVERE